MHTCHSSLGFAKCSSHTSLKPISSSAGQHLVDAVDVEGVQTDSQVESIFAAVLHQVFVGTDTASLQSFGRQLLILIRDHVHAQRKLIYFSLLAS